MQGEVAHKVAHKVYTHKVRTGCAQGAHKVRTRVTVDLVHSMVAHKAASTLCMRAGRTRSAQGAHKVIK